MSDISELFSASINISASIGVETGFLKVCFKNSLKKNLRIILNTDNITDINKILLSSIHCVFYSWGQFIQMKNVKPDIRYIDTPYQDIPDIVNSLESKNYILERFINYCINVLYINPNYIGRAFVFGGFENKSIDIIICDMIADWFLMDDINRSIESQNASEIIEAFNFGNKMDYDFLRSVIST